MSVYIILLAFFNLYIIYTYVAPSSPPETSKSDEGERIPDSDEAVIEQQNPAYVPLEECRNLKAEVGTSQSPQYVNDDM